MKFFNKIRTASILPLFFSLLIMGACAKKSSEEEGYPLSETGKLPVSGKTTIRCGMTWMNEDSDLFKSMEPAVAAKLAERGLTVEKVKSSAISPPPSQDISTNRPQAKQPAKGGQKELRLARYDIPEKDADLPDSVRKIKPPDAAISPFALSQYRGMPVLRNAGSIPGRIPTEMTATDPKVADYCLLIRFSLVLDPGLSARVNELHGPYLPDLAAARETHTYLLAAAAGNRRIPGVGSLGYGSPAPARSVPDRPGYGATPGDYGRGYEGMSPGDRDIWNREPDLLTREQARKFSEPPAVAEPPAYRRLPTMQDAPRDYPMPPSMSGHGRDRYVTGGDASSQGAAGAGSSARYIYVVEMDCWDLSGTGKAGQPKLLWQAAKKQPATSGDPFTAFPEIAAGMIEEADTN